MLRRTCSFRIAKHTSKNRDPFSSLLPPVVCLPLPLCSPFDSPLTLQSLASLLVSSELDIKMAAQNEVEMKDSNMTSADYYFDSYSHFGIHEV